MMRIWIYLFLSTSLVVCSLEAQLTAQQPDPRGDASSPQYLLPVPELEADPKIPTSQQVLRYRWGDDISNHLQIERYLQALAQAAPDRTKLVQYGSSYEGRSLNYLVISSPENLAKLDTVRNNNLKLADPRSCTAEQAAELIETAPAVIWLAYCVHGDEISPSDAALLTAYHLLADRRAVTADLLKQLVVVIDPVQNPDGRDRFVHTYRETRGVFDQSHRWANEHTQRWARGRWNHYWFDMNRDWFRHSQKEVKAKVAAYLDWQPQMYVDAHEMGANSTFYFPPAADPKNPYLEPAQLKWFQQLGRHQAGWFDRYGFGYMTREVFDAFYPGYGSEWPTLQGGLGILWEQASARGRVVDRSDNTKLTYHDGVRHQYISGLATLEFAAARRKQLLAGFHDSRAQAVRMGIDGDVSHYFIPVSTRPQRARQLAAMLQRNGIEVRTVKQRIRVECTDVKNDSEKTRVIPAGSFHIPVAQPAARLLRSLLDRTVDMDDKFLRRQLERNQLRLRDEIYDVTAWSMPLAFDVPCLATGEQLKIDSEVWDPGKVDQRQSFQQAKVAYLLPCTDGAIRAMSDLIQDGVRVHVCDETFSIGGRDYDRGTLIVKVAGNPDDLYQRLQAICQRFGAEVIPTDTAYVEKGAHMGGPKVHWVRPPKVLIVVNSPTYYSSGHTWHLFDQTLSYPSTRVNGTELARVNLNDFNTIVLPDGRYSAEQGFGEPVSKTLEHWIRGGGTLITTGGGTRWACSESVGLLRNEILKRKTDAAVKSTETDEQKKKDAVEEVTPDVVPGAFLRSRVFQKHWVTFGFDPTIDIFYTGNLVLSPTKETAGRSLVTFEKQDQLLTSGFCWPESLALLAETPYVVHRSVGRGNVVAFTDDPNFRAMYPSLQRLFINAAMFGAAHASAR